MLPLLMILLVFTTPQSSTSKDIEQIIAWCLWMCKRLCIFVDTVAAATTIVDAVLKVAVCLTSFSLFYAFHIYSQTSVLHTLHVLCTVYQVVYRERVLLLLAVNMKACQEISWDILKIIPSHPLCGKLTSLRGERERKEQESVYAYELEKGQRDVKFSTSTLVCCFNEFWRSLKLSFSPFVVGIAVAVTITVAVHIFFLHAYMCTYAQLHVYESNFLFMNVFVPMPIRCLFFTVCSLRISSVYCHVSVYMWTWFFIQDSLLFSIMLTHCDFFLRRLLILFVSNINMMLFPIPNFFFLPQLNITTIFTLCFMIINVANFACFRYFFFSLCKCYYWCCCCCCRCWY